MKWVEQIRAILNSGDVVRFHSCTGVDKQKNSEHQWGCALIVQFIYPECSKDLLLAALTHDAAECHTGDIPFSIKKDNTELSGLLRGIEIEWEKQHGIHFVLNVDEHVVLKIADTLEGMIFCISQVRNGNLNAEIPFYKWCQFFEDNLLRNVVCSAEAIQLFNSIVEEMKEL
tara:strand:+ start:3526 stop:4041 length:516 start_codon:yes stop_codon:yes gene_type:complete